MRSGFTILSNYFDMDRLRINSQANGSTRLKSTKIGLSQAYWNRLEIFQPSRVPFGRVQRAVPNLAPTNYVPVSVNSFKLTTDYY